MKKTNKPSKAMSWLFGRVEVLDERTEKERATSAYKLLKVIAPFALLGIYEILSGSMFTIAQLDTSLLSYVSSGTYTINMIWRIILLAYVFSLFLMKNVDIRKYLLYGLLNYVLVAGILQWELSLLLIITGASFAKILPFFVYASSVIGLLDGLYLQWRYGADLLKLRDNFLS